MHRFSDYNKMQWKLCYRQVKQSEKEVEIVKFDHSIRIKFSFKL